MYYDESAARTIGDGGGGGGGSNDYFSVRDECKKHLGTGATNKELDDCARNASLNGGGGGGSTDKTGIVNAHYGTVKTGGILKKGGYVYSDVILPFLL
jgi:hypothetical protein